MNKEMKQIYTIKDEVTNEDVNVEFESQEELEKYFKGGKPFLRKKIGTTNTYEAYYNQSLDE